MPEKGTCSNGDSAELIEVEKPNVLKSAELVVAEQNPLRDHFAGPWCERKRVDDHVKDNVQPPTNYNNNGPPSRDYPHDRTESDVIGLTAIEESIGEQSSYDIKLTGSPISVSSSSQCGKTTIMRDVLDTEASSHRTPTSSHTEDEPAVKRQKRTRAPKESKKRTWMGNRYTEPKPEKLLEIPIPLLL
ncbi:MAG: hypothetical protein LQ339_003145 [Xanthoria mediterranea]|nr:MAG: hypothetical protein LQ339_003145 [Xanthoria mediterranea]